MMAATLFPLMVLLGAPEQEMDELEAMQIAVRAAVDKVSPSVVTILTTGGIRNVEIPDEFKKKMSTPDRPREKDKRRLPAEDEDEVPPEGSTPRFKNPWQKMLAPPGFKKAEGPCTGVVVSSDGYIVTSAWNFESKPNSIVVSLDSGSSHAAKLLGIDRAAGLALLKIDAKDLKVPQMIDPKKVRVGDWAFAIGRTLGGKFPEVKYGIVSAKNRIEGNALQTDAATSPANYGGPLIDVEGRVYGVIVPLGSRGQETNPNWYDSGIGFVAPVAPESLIKRLGKEGVVLKPAFMGVSMNQDSTKPGAEVTQVVPDGPAHKAGVKKGDVVTRLGEDEVRNSFGLRFAVGRGRAGDKVKLTVTRGTETLTLEVTLGERPKPVVDKSKLPVALPSNKPKRDRDRGGR